jgi:hypothetical protein
MPRLGDIDGCERRLRAATVALNKRKVAGVTLVEAIDEAELWPNAFEAQQPFLPGLNVGALLERAPLYLCAIASEIGFRFEGVGTEYWNKLAGALGVPITMAERARFGDTFAALAGKYALSRPSDSAFSTHFSIISWPIANALLPLDLLGPVTRMLARAPATALPGPGRPINFPSLRAWASAAEGARLIDWLRFEAASERVLTALLTENRSGGISATSYARLQNAVTRSTEAFFATRLARQRARRTKVSATAQQSLGRLTLTRDAAGLKLYVSWPALPADLADEARITARAAGWRPQLWGAGARLHSDTALGDGPFLLTHTQVPRADRPAYAEAATTFGEGSNAAAALAGRNVDWNAASSVSVRSTTPQGPLGLLAALRSLRSTVSDSSAVSPATACLRPISPPMPTGRSSPRRDCSPLTTERSPRATRSMRSPRRKAWCGPLDPSSSTDPAPRCLLTSRNACKRAIGATLPGLASSACAANPRPNPI